jgi:Zn-dependent peptidase ImmA (M78 family)/transcriptional regulator with XRE-family HTH domain
MSIGASNFKGERLTNAREARGITQTSLADIIKVSRAAISQYEKGQRFPSSDILKKIASTLNFPMHFFLQGVSVQKSKPIFFRSMSATTKIARLRAERRYEWLLNIIEYLREFVTLPEVNFPRFALSSDIAAIDDEIIEDIASRTRKHWGLGFGPISNITWLLENNGAIVVRQELGAKTLDAFSSWIERNTPTPYFILGEEKQSAVRSRFDAAHELGHMILHHHVGEKELRNTSTFKLIEDQANHFASAFLLPEQTFSQEVFFAPNLEMLVPLKSKWRVSIAAMVKRLSQLRLISHEREQQLFINISRRHWRTNEPLDDELEIEKPRVLQKVFDILRNKNIINQHSLTINLGLYIEDIEAAIGIPGYFADTSGTTIKFPRVI